MSDDEDILLYMVDGTEAEKAEAFERALNRYRPNVARFVSRKLIYAVEKRDAADLVMETFEGLWDLVTAGKIGLESNLEALLITIAKNRVRDYLDRRSALKRTPPSSSEETDLLIDAFYGTEIGNQCMSVDVGIVEDALRELLPELGEIQRKVTLALLSRYPAIVDPAEVHEVCTGLGFHLTYVQVKNALPELLTRVRKRLSDLGAERR